MKNQETCSICPHPEESRVTKGNLAGIPPRRFQAVPITAHT